jgi:integrase
LLSLLLRLPKVNQRRPSFGPCSDAGFLSYVEGTPLYPMWLLLRTTGLRSSELLGARWVDLEFDSGVLTDVQTCVQVGSKPTLMLHANTESSYRTVSLDPQTLVTLRNHQLQQKNHQLQQKKERLVTGVPWTEDGLVFTQVDGQPIHRIGQQERWTRPPISWAFRGLVLIGSGYRCSVVQSAAKDPFDSAGTRFHRHHQPAIPALRYRDGPGRRPM